MRVEPNRIENIKTNPYVNRNIRNQKASFASCDSLEISDEAKALIDGEMDIRMDKVEKIKSEIDNGTYKVSSKDVANKILNDIKIYSDISSKRKL